tara:strand:+ start:4882 stop:5757 length:876 start_codon:yes stop_codon:yes gene_type:complete
VKIIFIASYPRSGSTILDVIIRKTKNSNFISIGEFFYIFEKGFNNNEKCADGVKFLEHPFWQKIFHGLNHNKASRELRFLKNPFFFPFFLLMGYLNKNILFKIFPNFFNVFYEILLRVCRESGNKIIIDASKDPRQLFILSLFSQINIEIIHLVRDVRATSFSWKRKKVYKENTYFRRKSVLRSSLRWLNDHLWTLFISKINYKTSYNRFFYEQFESLETLKFFGKTYLIDLNHKKTSFNVEIGGNINKFVNFKSITIDNDWKKNMKFIDYILVTSLMWPMLIFFKYKITR